MTVPFRNLIPNGAKNINGGFSGWNPEIYLSIL